MNLMSTGRARSISKHLSQRDLSKPLGRGVLSYLNSLQSQGRYVATKAEVVSALKPTEDSLRNAMWRLSKSGRIVSPHRGFYVIVPPEYQAAGTLPPSWIIRDLMAYLRRPYYVGLLSAAALHGAAHQSPQEFQVVTNRPLRSIQMGRARIVFVKKAQMVKTPTVAIKTPTGEILVSSPEATALDLVRYPEHAGGLGNVATILKDLAERLDPQVLVYAAASEQETAHVQRLGYLLEWVGHGQLVEPLAYWLAARDPHVVPLRPDRPIVGTERAARWRVALNAEIETDESEA